MNIKLIVAYDGTSFLGWQKTPMGPSIENTLQTTLEKILQHPITLQAASRTDAGVHANGQVVNFFTQKEFIDFNRLRLSLNQLLPPTIAILHAQQTHDSFHPTLDCKEKEYRYFICTNSTQMPQHRLYSWHCPRLHLLSDMQQTIPLFIGKKDYSSFCNFRKQQHYEHFIREVYSIEIEYPIPNHLIFKIRGKNFLYKMVRNIVGTLAYVGMGKLPPSTIQNIFTSHDRTLAGITAPAHGLFLHEVCY